MLAKLWNVKEIYITENGTSSADQPAADGIVYDLDRVMYLRNYLDPAPARDRARACRCAAISCGAFSTISNGPTATRPLRPALCRLRDAEAHAQAQRLFYKKVIARNAVA